MSSGRRDWLPRTRDGRIAMANTWWDVLSQKGITPWGVIEQPEIASFSAQIANAIAANKAARENPGDRVLIARANEAAKKEKK